jgi:acetyl-CoA carboxylase carboxyltransferase component
MTVKTIRAPMACSVVAIDAAAGQAVAAGALLAVVEAMKMEHELRAPADGVVRAVHVKCGDALSEDDAVFDFAIGTAAVPAHGAAPQAVAASALRPDLQAFLDRSAFVHDAARPEAVAKRHALGLRSARENIADLVDAGSFVEYGALAVAAQASRRSADDLVRNTPADGIVTGLATVAGRAIAVFAYDATVLAGTQGLRSHQKTDRLLGVALERRLPVVLFAEGGGGRPGDTDSPVVAGLHVSTFARFASLSGRVPTIGIAAGRCFAGNAALLGCCDVIIATAGANIGMGGPAMVEGGGLGLFRPEDIGPLAVQVGNGVVDLPVRDEAEAVAVAKRLLALLCGDARAATPPAGPALRDALPAQRSRSYAMHAVLAGLVDAGSLVELQAGHGPAVHTVLARIDGRAVALLASNPLHLGGAIDAAAARKAARLVDLADARGLPIVSLVDTPGFMVGPDAEAEGHVRAAGALFVAAARRSVPWAAVVLRKGYGLGAMALAGGGFHATVATAAWPSGEFGAMGLEGAVRLGFRKELAAQADEAAREALFQSLLAGQVEAGSALNMASTLELDAVIDPADTRAWLARVLAAYHPPRPQEETQRWPRHP